MKAEEVNNFTDYGTFRGCNVMGKILTICRKCIQDGTEPIIDYKLLKSKHHNTFYKEWWVITDNTITFYDYENENQIDTFGPYEYKREGNDIHIKKGASYESYVSLKIVSVSKDILEMEHLGLGFQGDWCVATYKRSRGNKDDLKWVN